MGGGLPSKNKNSQQYGINKINKLFKSAEELLTFTLLCENMEQWRTLTSTDLFGESFDAKKWISHTFKLQI